MQMGTHLRILNESFRMNINMMAFRSFSICVLVLRTKVASALEGLNRINSNHPGASGGRTYRVPGKTRDRFRKGMKGTQGHWQLFDMPWTEVNLGRSDRHQADKWLPLRHRRRHHSCVN